MPAPSIDADLLGRGGVQLGISGERATITLNRPETLNAQTPDTWRALRMIGDRLDPDVRVVVVRGAGRAFSAGLDRRMFTREGVNTDPGLLTLASAPADQADAAIALGQRAFAWLHDPARITVAAVRGHAVGAGFQLALACDLRVLADDARFTIAEPALGLVPDLGGTLPLVRCVGYARAAEICLSGRRVAAAEAQRIGLANAVVPAGELDRAVDDFVGAVLRAPAGTARETLSLLASAAAAPTLEQQMAAERAAQLRLLGGLLTPEESGGPTAGE